MSKKNKMNRKKHEKRRIEHNAHLKEVAALKHFRRSTFRILYAMGIPGFLSIIDKRDADFYFKTRIGTVRLVPEKGIKVSRRMLTQMRELLSYYLKTIVIKFEEGCFTLEDYMTAGYALAAFENRLKKSKHESSRDAHSILTRVREYVLEHDKEPTRKLLSIAQMIENVFSRINQSKYYLTKSTYGRIRETDLKFCFSYTFTLHQVKAITKDIMIDGKPRPAYKAGRPNLSRGIEWMQLCGKDLAIEGGEADKPMDVYVQSHALIRMRERIDTFDHSCLHLTLTYALEKKEITFLPNGKALLAYYIHEHKLGYFILDVIDGVVVVRTFLFITNSGAPEGDRLDKELKVGKFEKQYVGIDKLSTFVHSDLLKDERVRSVFEKVGLGYLNELDPEFYNRKNIQKKGYAADFIKYMNIDEKW